LTSCATTKVPPHWLREPEEIPYEGYGGWIDVHTFNKSRIAGEMIAISKDTVFVADIITLHAVASNDILSARLTTYNATDMSGYVLLGTLSTISNGWYLIFSGPLWMIGGSIAARYRLYDPIIDYPQKPLEQFRLFARYPQGLPADLDRDGIKMKTSLRY
jgi:hypothetical protein